MSKYFIVATSYYVHTVMFLSDYVFSDKECEFILLEENHRMSDFENKKIALYDSIEKAVVDCDYVWFIDSKLYPGIYGKVALLSSKYKKKLILSELNLDKKLYADSLQKELFQRKPTILSIGVGNSSQQYCTEIFLNRMLRNQNIEFDQFFSPTSKSILENICKNKMVNRELVRQLFNPRYNGKVCVKGIAFETFIDLMSCFDEIKSWNVDIIIININQNMARNKEVIKSLHSYFRCPAFFLCSQYVDVENNIPKTLFIRTKADCDIPIINDECARNEVENMIISTLSYPCHAHKLI